MKIDITSAAQVLAEHPAPALPLDQLCRLVGRRSGDSPPPERDLLAALATRPEHFLVLDPWTGPWKALLDRVESAEQAGAEWAGPMGLTPAMPWVVARPDASPPVPTRAQEGPAVGGRAKGRPWRVRSGRSVRSSRSSPRPGSALPPSGEAPPPAGAQEDPESTGPDPHAVHKGTRGPALERLRESLRWYALTVDTASPVHLARWTRMARQAQEAQEAYALKGDAED